MSANPLNNETIEEKEEVVEEKQEKSRTSLKQIRKFRVRKFPIWLRIIVVLILAVLTSIVGLMVGYGVVGEGNPTDALKIETWQHIIDIVEKEHE